MRRLPLLMLTIWFLSLAALAYAAPLPKGARLLGVDVSNSLNASYDQGFQAAKNAGMEFTSLALHWDSLENPNTTTPGGTVPGAYCNTGWAFADGYYSAYNTKLALMVGPIDTNNKRMPADLSGLAFDHPSVISRYQQVADYVLAQFPNTTLVCFSVGNEIDIYLNSDPLRAQYTNFYQAVATYLRAHHPGLQVGAKATFTGLTQTQVASLQTLNLSSDVVMATYYPMNNDFTVKAPTVVESDFATLVGLYPSKPIYFLEAGYQSATTCASSESLQASFVQHLFNAWDQQLGHVSLIHYVWLHDRSVSDVDTFSTYYGSWDPRFREYLRTLGLRTYNGQDKAGLAVFKQQAAERGWFTDYTPTVTLTVTPTATVSPTITVLPTLTPTPIQPTGPQRVSASPNPGREQILFALPSDQGEAVTIRIYTLSGERAYQLTRAAGSQASLVWNCRTAAPGVYLVRIERTGYPKETLKVAVVH